jgi:hypothetical protein
VAGRPGDVHPRTARFATSWHLERARAARFYFSPHQAIALDEIRASLGRPNGGGGVVFVEAPKKQG